MKLSVIITTYNAEEWLHKVLVGYSVQTIDDFEIVIAVEFCKFVTSKN